MKELTFSPGGEFRKHSKQYPTNLSKQVEEAEEGANRGGEEADARHHGGDHHQDVHVTPLLQARGHGEETNRWSMYWTTLERSTRKSIWTTLGCAANEQAGDNKLEAENAETIC